MNDLIICKLKKTYFKFERDIYIINAYVTPQNSSGKNKQDGKEMISEISNIVNNLMCKGDVIICGDFNSRIADHPCLVKHDDSNDYINLPDDYVPNEYIQRKSQDKVKKGYANDFISLITDNKLVVLNGRTLGDLSGAFTCITPKGPNTIDYFAVTNGLMHLVNFLEVQEFTPFSDHRPLQLTFNINKLNITNPKPLHEIYQRAPRRFLFDENSKNKLTEIQTSDELKSMLTDIKVKLTKLNNSETNRDEFLNLNKSYTDYLHSMAQSCLSMTKNKPNKKHNFIKPWFNWKCKLAKRELGKAARATSNHGDSEFLRTNFYHVKKFYSKLINKYKNEFLKNINKDIESGKILNWQQFKRLKQYKTKMQNFDSMDMSSRI